MQPFLRYIDRRILKDYSNAMYAYDFRLVFVVRGELDMQSGNDSYNLRTNDLVIIPPAVPYKITGVSSDPEVYLVNYDLDQNHSFLPPLPPVEEHRFDISSAIFPEDSDELQIRHISNCDFAKDILVRIMKEYMDVTEFYEEICNTMLHLILLECKRNSKNDAPQILPKIISYINDNYTKKISNKTIADHFGYHSFYLNRLLGKYMNTTIHKYVTECRLKEARRMLLYTNNSIAEISTAIGFDYPEYFSKIYKEYFSVTPSETRNTRKNM